MSFSASSIKAGEAFVEILTKDKLDKGLQSAQAKLRRWGTQLAVTGAKIIGSAGLLAAPFAAGVHLFTSMGSEITDMSARTGIGAEALQELGHAAKMTGASLEDVETATKFLQKNLAAAAAGSKEAQENFADLGLRAEDLAGLPVDAQLTKIGQALSEIHDPAKRTAAALGLFGRSGTSLLPMFENGAAGLAKLRAEARGLGLVMSESDVAAADALGDSLDTLWSQTKALGASFGAALAPALLLTAEALKSALALTIEFVREHRILVTVTAAAIASAIAFGSVLFGVGAASWAAGKAIAVLTSILGAVKVAFDAAAVSAFLANTAMLLIPLAIAAVIGLALYAVGAFDNLGTRATAAMSAISDAISGGRIDLAWKVVTTGMALQWAQAMLSIRQTWEGTKLSIMEGWNSMLGSMSAKLKNLFGFDVKAQRQAAIDNSDAANKAFQKAQQDFVNAQSAARQAKEDREKKFTPPELKFQPAAVAQHVEQVAFGSLGATGSVGASLLGRQSPERSVVKELEKTNKHLEDQGEDLEAIRRQVESGIVKFS